MTTYLLIDAANIFFRCRHVKRPGLTLEQQCGMVINTILFSTRAAWNKFEADHLIFCLEGSSWRHVHDSRYKADRRLLREQASEEQKEEDRAFYNAYTDLITFIQEKTACSVLRHPEAEADDMIATWVKLHPNDKNIIVSTDSDFVQLVSDNVTLYEPIKNVYFTPGGVFDKKDRRLDFSLNGGKVKVSDRILSKLEEHSAPKDWIELSKFTKIIRGDDGIFSAFPGVRMKGAKNKVGIQEAFADRHNKGYDWNTFMANKWQDHNGVTHLVKDRFKHNELLIDLQKIPEDLQECFAEAIEDVKEKDPPKMIGIHFLKFVQKYELQRVMDNQNSFIGIFIKGVPNAGK